MGRARWPNFSPAHTPAEDTFEGESEIFTEEGVYEWIDGGVTITKPKENLEEQVINGTGSTNSA